ncbi:MAG: hypothetical protein ACOC2W_00375 [bacterium]
MTLDDIALRLLHGESTDIPELDEEEQPEREVTAQIKYEIYLLSESIGTNTFEDNYYLFINEINQYNVEDYKILLYRFLEKLDEVYGFVFSEELNLNTFNERMWLLEFIKFLEFNNIEFLTSLYNKMNINLLKIDIDDYLREFSKATIFNIHSLDEIYTYNKLILDYLINYNEYDLITWLIRHTKKNKIEIESNLKMKREE